MLFNNYINLKYIKKNSISRKITLMTTNPGKKHQMHFTLKFQILITNI